MNLILKKKKFEQSLFLSFISGFLCGFPQVNPSFFPLLFLGFFFIFYRPFTFQSGFFFGYGYFITTLYWTIYAFEVFDIKRFGILCLFLLSSYLACYKGFIFYFLKKTPYPKLFFPFLWILGDMLQENLYDLSFPWGYISCTVSNIEFLQIIYLIGIHGLSFIVISIILSILFGNILIRTLGILSCILIYLYGFQRLKYNPTSFDSHLIRLVQPNISQKEKHNLKHIPQHLEKYNLLSNSPSTKKIDLLLWPESIIVPFANQELIDFISQYVNTPLVFGALTSGKNFSFLKKDKFFNSVLMINQAKIINHYEKIKLVPFGECNPIPFFSTSFDHFNKGGEHKLFQINHLPKFRPFICFESVFKYKSIGEKWRLNLTNDAWFKDSAGPYQHFQLTKLRAIEANIPMVRVANHGISAIIDRCGRIIHKLNINQTAYIDFHLPI